jgi:hypothetical protein
VLEFVVFCRMTIEPIRAMLVFMRMTLFRKLLLIWMIAWLPLSGAMAAVMPFGSTTAKVATVDGTMAMVDAAEDFTLAMPCHSQTKSGMEQTGGTCNHCELCHIAGSIMPPALPHIDATAVHNSPASFASADFISFFPEQPQRPPLASRD